MSVTLNHMNNSIIDSFINDNKGTINNSRQEAKVFLNIGYTSKEVDANGEPIFISLPYGLALDTMPNIKVSDRSQSSYADLQRKKNAFKDALLQAIANMPAGTRKKIKLEVEIYKVSDAVAEDTDTSELNNIMNNLF